ncbi:cytidylyltransferase domain-containing protein [Paenibacillus terreus]|uniref:Cytidylyltransferase domain-containing protein n=1 Tax=Paenibacillus terreus TaxID=1387834 RepID=A0ABV5B7C8_9BACL
MIPKGVQTMIEGKRVLVIVPARSGSKGLPGKNMMSLLGKPLLAWPIETALASRYVDRVVVSTDSESYASYARSCGAHIPVLRPASLATDQASSSDVVVHMLQQLAQAGESYEILVLLEPTSPLTEANDVDHALEKLIHCGQRATAIVGVGVITAAHPEFAMAITDQGYLRPYQTISRQPGRRQDITPLYHLDGSLYISYTSSFLQHRTFYHERTLPFIMPKYKALEIDDWVDFICVEAILAHKNKWTNGGTCDA